MSTPSGSIDLAQAHYRDLWLHHEAIGDPSWDTFVREPGNPIYTGTPPHEWPVNGFLFRDPPTGKWYAYIGLYPRGYWPAGPCLVMRERDGGGWEEAGLAIQGDAAMFDGDGQRPGAMPDVSVVYAGGRYHMVYDWACPDNTRGGIAYAWADRPEGPFHRAPAPIHEDTQQAQAPILGRYVRAYAATLIQREHDWIILHDMSTPGNAGGTWAMACMTAPSPEGPYSAPTLLLYPQSDAFLPALMEYYPAFAHDGFVYAPATSVALNRSFQCVFRAPIEQAHLPSAWRLFQHGSVWHDEPNAAEAQGIWGQTFSAQVEPSSEHNMRAYFTSKTHEDTGTVHLARRRWDAPYRDGFTLSAPNGPAFAILRRHYRAFQLNLSVQASGAWSLCWASQSPLGPDRTVANATAHALMHAQQARWQRDGSAWRLTLLDETGEAEQQSGVLRPPASGRETIELTQDEYSISLVLNGQPICMVAHAATAGRLQLVAQSGTILRVQHFNVAGTAEPACERWLSTEALAGAAANLDGRSWQHVDHETFRYGFGCVSADPDARAKWNYHGSSFRLFAPRGPAYGLAEVIADGESLGVVDLHADKPQPSAVVRSHDLPAGYHAVAIGAVSGVIPCDVLEITPVAD
jgi:hypothetical protein